MRPPRRVSPSVGLDRNRQSSIDRNNSLVVEIATRTGTLLKLIISNLTNLNRSIRIGLQIHVSGIGTQESLADRKSGKGERRLRDGLSGLYSSDTRHNYVLQFKMFYGISSNES